MRNQKPPFEITNQMIDNVAEIAEKENINEEMKYNQQLLWIKNMNNIKNRAEEIILKEYIYV